MLSRTLETERLILRRYEEKDINTLLEILTDKRLTEYKLVSYEDLTKEEKINLIKDWIRKSKTSLTEKWVIEVKETHEVVGNIVVNNVIRKPNYCNVGYAILYNYWGNGYATEALKAVSYYLLNYRNYYLVECSCNENNIRSIRVLEKSGFIKDGYINNRRINKDGTYSSVVYYSKKNIISL